MTQICRYKYTLGHNHNQFKEFYQDIPARFLEGQDSFENWQETVNEKGSSWKYYDRDLFFGYQWNKLGHRNDYEFNSWGDAPWILALGDSNVEGTGNRRIDLFHEVVAKERGFVNYNAGLGGTSNHTSIWNGLTLLNLAETKPQYVLLRLTDTRRYSIINQYDAKLADINKKGIMSYETDVSKTGDIKNVQHGGYMFHQGSWTVEEQWLNLLLDRDEHKIDKSETRILFLMFQQYCYKNDIPLVLLTQTGQMESDNWEKYAKIPGAIEVNEISGDDGPWHMIEKARDNMHFGAGQHFRIAKRILEAI